MLVNMAIYSYRLIFIPQLSVPLVVSYIDTELIYITGSYLFRYTQNLSYSSLYVATSKVPHQM